MKRVAGMLFFAAIPAFAEPGGSPAVPTLETVRTIRPGEVIAPADLRIVISDATGALSSPEDAVGLSARRLLSAGQPLMPADLGPPAVVRRNSVVPLVFARGGLMIRTDGRALGDAAPGERVRVMNLASRQTVTGTVTADGSVETGETR
jgi:flagella basal body P-ring formation protein FlgA